MSPRSGGAASAPGGRPAVSVIVPFAGGPEAARALLAGLSRLRLRESDQVIVADNAPQPTVGAGPGDAVTVVRAAHEASSYHARNAGAEAASAEWLLFLDADCRPEPDLLDAYFSSPVPKECAVVAGSVRGDPEQGGVLPGWARSRRQLSEEHLLTPPPGGPHPATGTGNVLVRRRAWEALGGFHEGVRSGADVELCWRLQDAGWTLEHRPEAAVGHRYRRRLRSLLGQAARHAAGRRWVARRYAGSFRRPALGRDLVRAVAGSVGWTIMLQPRRGRHKAIDGIVALAAAAGWWLGSNRVRPLAERRFPAAGERSLVVITDAFPARSETFVYNEALNLISQGWELRVESLARPVRVERPVARRLRIDYLEDDPPRDKLVALLWLVARHPLPCLRDLRDRRRWRREEPVWALAAIAPAARRLARGRERHLHAHFAAGGALQALRLSRLIGVPYGVTAHAYDIFQRPRNLADKVRGASFAAAECEYAADALREAAGSQAAGRVHRIATGTDARRFARRAPTPDRGRVLAIGRLVEKKGFAHLVDAAALLREDSSVSEVRIAGEGPLAGDLATRITDLGIDGFVRLHGPLWGPDAVRELLEGADLLAIPSVIAADGDRDALPLVAYEALAMEVPVVASDLVGLPELVRAPWGRLVPPGDHRALAAAIHEVLSLPVAERRRAAALGRELVIRRYDPEHEAARLAELHLAA